MTLAILIAISLMWISVAILFLGKGEAKGTGAITAFVGLVVVLGAFLQTALFKDPFTGGLLFAHGLLYCTVAYALLAGLEDLRSVGNVSLAVALISFIYMIIFFTGGTGADGSVLVGKSNYFAFACLGYTILTLQVWLNAYGKVKASTLAWSLIIWVPIGLWIPAFMLLSTGRLPF
ncbi:AmiS/UreI family transporter [Geoalkalibacter halelectricus]|uniref:Transporter n=1 Tax=Geoalkalibacter halelectricus TaxID=2847045 RepID=A0ABY5ZIJ3_9BACT|nr:AmiS/UreI family transporter [Geoalkalibacter halelectricus]MDO3377249.1 transporter [Geoalkalibacter halelectricus]UWZ78888.1 transporter [Geoalkalibacter halelectricus]